MTRPVTVHLQPGRLVLSFVLLSCTLLLAGCDEPFVVLPGGELKGTVIDPPADWEEMPDVDIVQLETNPDDPYSVNIWLVTIGADAYIATGDDPTTWSEYLDTNPDVRLKIRKNIYELEANRVIDNREKRAVGMAYVEKYALEPDDNWVLNGQAFRLDRR